MTNLCHTENRWSQERSRRCRISYSIFPSTGYQPYSLAAFSPLRDGKPIDSLRPTGFKDEKVEYMLPIWTVELLDFTAAVQQEILQLPRLHAYAHARSTWE